MEDAYSSDIFITNVKGEEEGGEIDTITKNKNILFFNDSSPSSFLRKNNNIIKSNIYNNQSDFYYH